MKESSKKSKVLLIITIITLILLVGGATFAFFQAQGDSGKEAGVNVTTNTVDSLVFNITKDIVLDDINQDTFASGGENKSDTSEATAVLKANNKTANAEVKEEITKTYNMYFEISNNDFEYTTTAPDQKAELILNVKVSKTGNDADLEEVTTINGLNYTTVNGVSGFDVTEIDGPIKIAEDYEIKALSGETTTHKWKFTLTFVNLDSDQNANTGKTFNGTLKLQKEKNTYLADYIKGLYTVDGENGLYLHDADLENGAGDNSYRYSGANYKLTAKASMYDNVYDSSSTANGIVKIYCSRGDEYSYFGEYCSSSYTKFYYLATNSEIHYDTSSEALQVAVGQEYIEPYIKNYVCFGTDTIPCPENNLYQIIGVFDNKVKLIKKTSIGNIAWDDARKNIWSTATLNTVTLNGTYLTALGDYAKTIAMTRWQVGGGTYDQLEEVTPSIAYQNEVGTPVNDITYDSKIGLMYASDYGFATSPANWTTKLRTYYVDGIINNNWMFLTGEWTITPEISKSTLVFNVSDDGSLEDKRVNIDYDVRPTFYLDASVTYTSGTGTETDPIRIN